MDAKRDASRPPRPHHQGLSDLISDLDEGIVMIDVGSPTVNGSARLSSKIVIKADIATFLQPSAPIITIAINICIASPYQSAFSALTAVAISRIAAASACNYDVSQPHKPFQGLMARCHQTNYMRLIWVSFHTMSVGTDLRTPFTSFKTRRLSACDKSLCFLTAAGGLGSPRP